MLRSLRERSRPEDGTAGARPRPPRPDRAAALLELVAVCRSGITHGAVAARLVELLHRTFDAKALIFGSEAAFGGWWRESGIPAGWTDAYTKVRHLDPFVTALPRLPVGAMYVVSRLGGAHVGELERAFRAFGFTDALLSKLPGALECHPMIALYRMRQQVPYDDGDLALFSAAVPHLGDALRGVRALGALLAPPGQTLEEALRTVPGWAYVSPPSSRVEWSASARRMLEERGLARRALAGVESALCLAVARRCCTSATSVPTRLPGRLPIEVFLQPPRAGEISRALCIIGENAPPPVWPALRPPPPRLPVEVLLTRRQLEIARLTARGRSAADVARALGLGRESVRTHLRAVYERLGIRRRHELTDLLLPAE